MSKKVILISILLIVLPVIMAIGLTCVIGNITGNGRIMYDMPWVLLWRGTQIIPLFLYILGMLVAVKSVLVKQNRFLLCGCAFAGAMLVLLTLMLPLFGVNLGDYSTVHYYFKRFTPLGITNIFFGVHILRKKALA